MAITLDPTDLLVFLDIDVGREGDGTHDPIAELLVEDGLVSIAVVLDDLIQSIHQWLFRRHVHHMSAVRPLEQLGLELAMVDIKDRGELLDILCRCLGLTVEDSGNGNFVATEFLGQRLKGDTLLLLGFKEGWRGLGKTWEE